MIKQKKGSRALWAVAFAAAPIGALATPVNTPTPTCEDSGQLSRVSWSDGYYVGSKDTVLGATINLGSDTKVDVVPFVCGASDSGWDLTKTDTSSETKTGEPSGSDVFATANLDQGNSFSINFGQVLGSPYDTKGGFPTKDPIGFFPTISAYDYTTSMPGFEAESKGGQVWVTDLNLGFDATYLLTGNVLYQDYLGVQVISGASALESKFFFDNNTGDFILDPPISGFTKVNLLSSPDPHSVPEPAGWALMGAGLLGLGVATRGRKKKISVGGEPGA